MLTMLILMPIMPIITAILLSTFGGSTAPVAGRLGFDSGRSMEGRTDYNGCKACGEWKLAQSKMIAKRAQSAQVTPTATVVTSIRLYRLPRWGRPD